MLNTAYDVIAEVLVRGNVSTTSASDALYTDTVLRDWVDMAHRWAASFRKWPLTEGRQSTTWTGSEEVPYPEGYKPDSIRYLTVGGDRMQKVSFEDYQRYKEDFPTGTDRIYSDYASLLYLNVNADVSGSLTMYGQYVPAAIDVTDDTAKTVFSDREEDGNEAMVEEMLRYAKLREKKPDEAAIHHQRAVDLLEGIWKRFADEQFGYHTKDRGMFEYFDVLEGQKSDDFIRRDRFF